MPVFSHSSQQGRFTPLSNLKLYARLCVNPREGTQIFKESVISRLRASALACCQLRHSQVSGARCSGSTGAGAGSSGFQLQPWHYLSEGRWPTQLTYGPQISVLFSPGSSCLFVIILTWVRLFFCYYFCFFSHCLYYFIVLMYGFLLKVAPNPTVK